MVLLEKGTLWFKKMDFSYFKHSLLQHNTDAKVMIN